MRRRKPPRCTVCDEREGVIWQGGALLCFVCDAASRPMEKPTPEELARAVGRVVTGHGAVEIAKKRGRRT